MSTPPPAAATPRPPRVAATTIVVRPAPGAIEVLMLQRAEKGDHNSGAWVFPGGLVDAADRGTHSCCAGLDDAQASTCLGVSEGGLDFYVTAIRESFEEAGLLFARDERGQFPRPDVPARLAPMRGPVARGEVDFGALCRAEGLTLAADVLHYVAHWVTPADMPKRFDTRFFLAAMPPDQQAGMDANELVQHGWFRPGDLLREGVTRKLLRVTRAMLEMVARFDNVDTLLAWAASPREVQRVERASRSAP